MAKTLIRVFIGLSLVLIAFSFIYAQPENYCQNNESWKEWDALIEKSANDMEIQALHVLRIGLCVKVDRGGITIDQATEIFESAREAIIQKRKEDQKKEQDRQKLQGLGRCEMLRGLWVLVKYIIYLAIIVGFVGFFAVLINFLVRQVQANKVN